MREAQRSAAWHADDFSPCIASVRLRMLMPMRELQKLGVPAVALDESADPARHHTIVFSKCFGEPALGLARRAKAAGTRIVYDICDSLHDARPSAKRQRRLRMLDEFLEIADDVVFSTPTLRQQMVGRHPDIAARSHVIPDVLEPIDEAACAPGAADLRELDRLDRFLRAHPGALHCVWFGKSQGRLAGLAHLARATQQLERFARTRPVTLTVISNDWLKYRLHALGWAIPHHYLPWSLASFALAMKRHHVAVIPLEKNGYTAGKTINRPATALMCGLGVVADAIESYEELRPYIFLDDWQGGLAHYAAPSASRDVRLERARAHLRTRYGGEHVALHWKALLDEGHAPA